MNKNFVIFVASVMSLQNYTHNIYFATHVIRTTVTAEADTAIGEAMIGKIQRKAMNLAPMICNKNPNIVPFLKVRTAYIHLNGTQALYPALAESYGNGSLVSGLFNRGDTVIRVELMDPRGFNPPFGQGEHLFLEPGELVLYWAAQPVLIPPQKGALVKVEVGFFGLSPEGLRVVLDFERDPCAYILLCCKLRN